MKSTFLAALTAIAAREVASHATFQQLWVDGTDYIRPPSLPPFLPHTISTLLTP
jgi:hypothetical protein